jgi:pyruvate kinase
MRSRLRRGIHPHVLPHTNLREILRPSDAAAAGCVLSKVVGTLGPACVETNTLAAMLRAGLSCARIDLTWGGLAFHMRALANLNEVRAVWRVFAWPFPAARASQIT